MQMYYIYLLLGNLSENLVFILKFYFYILSWKPAKLNARPRLCALLCSDLSSAVSPRPYKFVQTYLILPTSVLKKRHGTALDETVLRQWPLCYTRIGYRRTMVRRELCLSYAVNHGVGHVNKVRSQITQTLIVNLKPFHASWFLLNFILVPLSHILPTPILVPSEPYRAYHL